jgi:hypothetical protein
MLDLHQVRNGRLADALRGAVGREQLRMRGFELLQLVHQPVVLQVRNFRRRLDVILVIVMTNQLPQLVHAHRGGFHGTAPGRARREATDERK